MAKYIEYEKNVIKWVKRGIITKNDAIERVTGYLRAMVDFEQLPQDRFSCELEITVKKILEIA